MQQKEHVMRNPHERQDRARAAAKRAARRRFLRWRWEKKLLRKAERHVESANAGGAR